MKDYNREDDPPPYEWESEKVTKIVIEDGITSIGSCAFGFLIYLESVSIPNSVESIGLASFQFARSLKSVVIPQNVKSIHRLAFSGCKQLKEIYFLGDIPNIASNPFSGVVATVIYPKNNATYTFEKMQDYGGNLTWVWKADCDHESAIIRPAVDATCTENGMTEGKYCTECNIAIIKPQIIPALGHDISVDISAIEPTCTAEGRTEASHCERCHAVLSESVEIPALGHIDVIDPYKAPTCTKTGLTAGYHCKRCGEIFVAQQVIDPLGHDWVNPSPILNEQDKNVKMFHICSRDQSHAEIIELNTLWIPDQLTEIAEESFSGISCEAVIIPDDCLTIYDKAFANCQNLLYVYIPSSVKSIASNAFDGCESVFIDKK